MSLADPFGKVLTEIRDDAVVAAITTRIRGGEPAPGDALGPDKYQAFVVLTGLGHTRLKRAPIQEVRLLAKCYGVTAQGATALAAAVSDALHAKGHRISATGISIFDTFDDGGEGENRDPDTQQWHADVVIQINASTALIT